MARGADRGMTEIRTPRGKRRSGSSAPQAGLPARREAVRLIAEVLETGRPFDELFRLSAADGPLSGLAPRDRALVRAIAATAFRHKLAIDDILGRFLSRPLPRRAGGVYATLLSGAAQLLFLRVPAHAAIDLAVSLAAGDRQMRPFKGLVNAVLRKVSAEGAAIAAGQDAARIATPDWLWRRWVAAYGEAEARAIAEAHLAGAALDITVADEAQAAGWADRLGGVLLPTGTVRIADHSGRVEELAGYGEGAWWVQDAAAALPVRLLGEVRGAHVVDLCAAPGGKAMQLAARGARVTAIDSSAHRLARLAENLKRTGLAADTVHGDAALWRPAEPADAVLLDAPCSATGTIRRHPDLPHIKMPEQIGTLAGLQSALLAHALTLVKPGGLVVYCSCSLEPEEGPEVVAKALADGRAERVPVRADELAGLGHFVTAEGDLRTLPGQAVDAAGDLKGLDGFFAARLRAL